jgi:predicted AlkP superfamily pyrophosphatase or phosphodiesterase
MEAPLVPDYEGACLSRLVPALLGGDRSWLPEPVRPPGHPTVLLVIDGLGWLQLSERRALAPCLAALSGGPIHSVTPTTTATALTSISTGTPPGEHGVVGYRMYVHGDVLNVLRWSTAEGDARRRIPPEQIQHRSAFRGTQPVAVTKAEFATSGFTLAHLAGVRHRGWRLPSTLIVETAAAIRAGERFVYAYYDGPDRVAHEYGLGPHYDAELTATDDLVAQLLGALPAGTRLVVTADHGQVDVGSNIVTPAREVLAHARLQSGEGRFRWLHAQRGREAELLAAATAAHGHHAWVVSLAQMRDERWFGPQLAPAAAARLGDVALVARDPISFDDPADSGSFTLIARHGSLTAAEVLVPLLAATA